MDAVIPTGEATEVDISEYVAELLRQIAGQPMSPRIGLCAVPVRLFGGAHKERKHG